MSRTFNIPSLKSINKGPTMKILDLSKLSLNEIVDNYCFNSSALPKQHLKNKKWWSNRNIEQYYYELKIDKFKTFSEAIYCFINSTKSPKCKFCNKNKTSFISFKKGYHKFCSNICANKYNIEV